MSSDDILSQMRDQYLLGNFRRVLKLGKEYTADSDMAGKDAESVQARAELALGHFDRVEGIPGVADASLQAVKYCAAFIQGKDTKGLLDQLAELSQKSRSPAARMCWATCLALSDDLQKALQITADNPTLDLRALHCYILLRMDRSDLADSYLAELTSASDDAAASKLASCWMNLVRADYQEAYLTYCDLQSQFHMGIEHGAAPEETSLSILNGMAVANMTRRNWQEALEDLQKAQKLDPADVSTLANLVTTYRYLKKDEDADAAVQLLASHDPEHPIIVKNKAIDLAFERFTAQT